MAFFLSAAERWKRAGRALEPDRARPGPVGFDDEPNPDFGNSGAIYLISPAFTSSRIYHVLVQVPAPRLTRSVGPLPPFLQPADYGN